MRRDYIALVMVIISIVIFYFLILPSFSLAQFLESLNNVNPIVFFLALVAVAISQIIASVRWSLLMQEVNAKKSQILVNALGTFSIGQVAGLIVPSRIGAYAKVPIIMKMDNLSYETGVSAVNAETVFDLVYICCAGIASFFIMSSFLLSYTSLTIAFIKLIMGFLLGAMVLLFLFKNIDKISSKLVAISQDACKDVFTRALAYYVGKLVGLILSTKILLRRKKLVVELGSTTLIIQFFSIVGLFLVIGSTNMGLPFPEVFALLTISYIIGIASMVPGGIGASDLSLIVLLGSEGIPIAIATNIAILWRVAMYLPIFIIIGVFLVQQRISGKDIIV